MELEAIKTLLDIGSQGLFLWLYLRLDDRLVRESAKHDADLQRIQDQRIQDLKLMARLPTDLEGVPPVKLAIS